MILFRRAAAVAVALLLAGAALTGCTVGQPDAKGWTEIARTALTDAAGEVATARLTVAAARDDEVRRRLGTGRGPRGCGRRDPAAHGVIVCGSRGRVPMG